MKKKNEPNIYILIWYMDSINLSPSKSTIKWKIKRAYLMIKLMDLYLRKNLNYLVRVFPLI